MKSFVIKLLKNKYFYFLFVCLVVFYILFLYSLKKVPIVTTTFNTNYNIGYDVYIVDNEFFDTNVLGMEKQYITKLIDYIKVKSDIEYKFSSKISFSYVTDITSKVTVKNTNTEKNLLEYSEKNYHFDEKIDLMDNKTINNCVDIDFKKYNEMVKNFVGEFNLKNVSSTLEIVVYVKMTGNKGTISEKFNDSMKIKYIIPLNEDTVDIKTEYISNNNDLNYFSYQVKDVNENKYILLLIVDLFLIAFFNYKLFGDDIKTIIKKLSLSGEREESNRIMKKYGAFIHEVKSFNFNKYSEKINLLTFEALLDIKDSSGGIIMMKKGKSNIYFFILQGNSLFIYISK
ncbi:MAG: DUF5305 family protein [Bacilli bacterium]|nr:DUF5305 family protein [Bacilli bacterium]